MSTPVSPAPVPPAGAAAARRVPARRRDLWLLVAGQTASQLGTQVGGVAVPLLAVVVLHAGPLQMAFLGASSTVGFALIGLPAGAWVDRVRRRPLLVHADLLRGLLLASVPVAWFCHALTMVQLLVVAWAAGMARVVFDIGYQSYLPSLVPRDRVLSGNAALETVRSGGQLAGPGLGGFLVSLAGAAPVVVVDAVSYLVSAVCLLAIRSPEPRPVRREDPHLRREVSEGLRYVLRHPVLRSIAGTSAVCNLAFAASGAVTFVFLVRDLRLGPGGVGLLLTVGAAAVMPGAALAPRLARWLGSARLVWLSLAVTGPFALLVPLARPGWGVWPFAVGSAVCEFGQIVYAITNLSLRQVLCPDHLLGRVNATMRTLVMGALPLGSLAGGALGEALGLRAALWVIAVCLAGAVLPLVRPLRGCRDVGDVAAPSPAV